MFTLLVSWLLVACVPGLLMLAALGLGRLESELARESITSTDVDEFLEQAQAMDMHTLAREGMPEALEYLHRRQAQQLALSAPPSGRHRAESLLATAFTDPRACVTDANTRAFRRKYAICGNQTRRSCVALAR